MDFASIGIAHRTQVETLLRATGAFSEEEIAVALSLFSDGDDYRFLGAFEPLEGEAPELVGYACYGPTPSTDRTFDLYWIAVHPSHQRCGAGTRLLGDVERRLHAEGARLVIVETSSRPDYARTRDFYSRRGYASVARVRDFYGRADDRLVYSKRLVAGQGGRSGVTER